VQPGELPLDPARCENLLHLKCLLAQNEQQVLLLYRLKTQVSQGSALLQRCVKLLNSQPELKPQRMLHSGFLLGAPGCLLAKTTNFAALQTCSLPKGPTPLLQVLGGGEPSGELRCAITAMLCM
jgi:hypothetical protein